MHTHSRWSLRRGLGAAQDPRVRTFRRSRPLVAPPSHTAQHSFALHPWCYTTGMGTELEGETASSRVNHGCERRARQVRRPLRAVGAAAGGRGGGGLHDRLVYRRQSVFSILRVYRDTTKLALRSVSPASAHSAPRREILLSWQDASLADNHPVVPLRRARHGVREAQDGVVACHQRPDVVPDSGRA
jgi:hypothetical protein